MRLLLLALLLVVIDLWPAVVLGPLKTLAPAGVVESLSQTREALDALLDLLWPLGDLQALLPDTPAARIGWDWATRIARVTSQWLSAKTVWAAVCRLCRCRRRTEQGAAQTPATRSERKEPAWFDDGAPRNVPGDAKESRGQDGDDLWNPSGPRQRRPASSALTTAESVPDYLRQTIDTDGLGGVPDSLLGQVAHPDEIQSLGNLVGDPTDHTPLEYIFS